MLLLLLFANNAEFPKMILSAEQIEETSYFFLTLQENRLPQWDKHYVYLFNYNEKKAINKFRIPEASGGIVVKGNTRNVFISAGNKLCVYDTEVPNGSPVWSTDVFSSDFPVLNISRPVRSGDTFFVFPSVAQGYLSFACISPCPSDNANSHGSNSNSGRDDDNDDDDDDDGDGDAAPSPKYKVTVIKNIYAHYGQLSCTAISNDGSLVATASDKGTVIRIFDTTGPCDKASKEFRRGQTRSEIKDIRFAPDKRVLAAISGSGTCHLFGLDGRIANRSAYYGLGYDWSSCDIACSAPGLSIYKAAFVSSEKLIVVDSSGKALVAILTLEEGKQISVFSQKIFDYPFA